MLHASANEPPAHAAKPEADAARKLAADIAKPASAKPAADKADKAAPAADKAAADKAAALAIARAADKSVADKAAAEKEPKGEKAVDKPGKTSASTADKAASAISATSEEDAEVDLSVRIAERLAEMRAKQAARMAAAAKAKKAAEAKRKKEAAAAAAVAVAAAAPKISNHWDYEGEFGPENWGKINPAWSQCGAGKRQSPIDIRDGMKVSLDEIDFNYRYSDYTEVDNGKTVQVNLARGNFMTIGNQSYELVQFHFHRPSEEKINGKGTEMVIHLEHRGPGGKLAIVAVLLERGKANDAIQTVWNNIPLEKNQQVASSEPLDPLELLPERREYYTYMGSQTTPPCTENVLWLVMKQPMTASPAQMALFSRLYPLNARPVQESEGRMVKESN
ncbi:carbonic anhydrase family protein [Massilia sp. IC2-278]|uniref:carbonic anhydrase n=1 Tax=Massilia sp. IC2-278 TaxID=2887200 RepID=UPI001E45D426|nr:carbonic anhydrase family protein [Massilia sp. IC2-278]MCC2960867.1 carbonic anhydrase family protein [Massilia sp. IC2-278]